MTAAQGSLLALPAAMDAFERLPAAWQLASLSPAAVEADAARDAALRPAHWCFADAGALLLHSFLLGGVPGTVFRDIQSAYGYGGPLSSSEDRAFLDAADAAFRAWASSEGVLAEFLRFHPLVPHERWYGGRVADNRATVLVDLRGDFTARYEGRRRTDIRRFGESGLTVEKVPPEVMLRLFPEIYQRNMDDAGAAGSYYFPSAYFAAVLGKADADGWLVYSGSEAVAGAVMLHSARAGVVEYHLGAMTPDHKRQKPSIGLLHAAAAHYQARGFHSFYLGGGRSTAPDDTLLFFKQGFSPLTSTFRIGHRVHDARGYEQLRQALPDKSAGGRVLFYRD
jgi:hypothetical protein